MKTTFIAFRLFIILTVLTGIIYPLAITGVAKAFWPSQAGGSLIMQEDQIIGSKLIAQKFESDKFFWPRPSAADYNAAASSGSNKGPTNADLKKIYDEGKAKGLPDEMIFSSGSGLDPHIRPATAHAQVARIASARGLSEEKNHELHQLIDQMTEGRTFGILGEERINVLELNLKLAQTF